MEQEKGQMGTDEGVWSGTGKTQPLQISKVVAMNSFVFPSIAFYCTSRNFKDLTSLLT